MDFISGLHSLVNLVVCTTNIAAVLLYRITEWGVFYNVFSVQCDLGTGYTKRLGLSDWQLATYN